jgi:predicted Zn-dependent protease
LSANRPDLAAPAARAAVILQGDNPSMHHLLAQALAGTGDWKGAAIERRASLDTGFADRGRSWLLLAQDLIQAGDTSAAVSALDSAAVRDLTQPEQQLLSELRTTAGSGAR